MAGYCVIPKKWESVPTDEVVKQTDLYLYRRVNEWITMARKIMEENKNKIEEANTRHRNNRSCKEISVLNHAATAEMPGVIQWEDYQHNKKARNKEYTDQVE